MISKAKTPSLPTEKRKITKQELKERIEAKLLTRGITESKEATTEAIYQASVAAIKDIMIEYREEFKKRKKATSAKKICYLCNCIIITYHIQYFPCYLLACYIFLMFF